MEEEEGPKKKKHKKDKKEKKHKKEKKAKKEKKKKKDKKKKKSKSKDNEEDEGTRVFCCFLSRFSFFFLSSLDCTEPFSSASGLSPVRLFFACICALVEARLSLWSSSFALLLCVGYCAFILGRSFQVSRGYHAVCVSLRSCPFCVCRHAGACVALFNVFPPHAL